MEWQEVPGLVFDIQRFSIHDGPGIRTNVFLKGCPLDCAWCHNPESKEVAPEIAWYPDKCTSCGACAEVCPENCHSFGEAGRGFDRKTCNRCGACAAVCVTGALALIGRRVSAEEVLAEVLRDEPFYRNSGGGMTLSGGEPFYQAEFSLALLILAKERGLHTCVETSGAAAFEILRTALAVTDLFLYDVKETNGERHRLFTGVSGCLIQENLEKLDAAGASILLRCPVIPGYNDREEHFREIGRLANRLRNVTGIDLEPYHPLGISKAASIGKPARHTDTAISSGDCSAAWAGMLRRYTSVPVALA
jgi:pyruvate formate lyase activating enzyme